MKIFTQLKELLEFHFEFLAYHPFFSMRYEAVPDKLDCWGYVIFVLPVKLEDVKLFADRLDLDFFRIVVVNLHELLQYEQGLFGQSITA